MNLLDVGFHTEEMWVLRFSVQTSQEPRRKGLAVWVAGGTITSTRKHRDTLAQWHACLDPSEALLNSHTMSLPSWDYFCSCLLISSVYVYSREDNEQGNKQRMGGAAVKLWIGCDCVKTDLLLHISCLIASLITFSLLISWLPTLHCTQPKESSCILTLSEETEIKCYTIPSTTSGFQN